MTSPASKDDNAPPKGNSFEESIQELENIIQRMSSGDQPLEKSISEFERGIQITRECQKMLKEAEQRVELLTKSIDGESDVQPFKSE